MVRSAGDGNAAYTSGISRLRPDQRHTLGMNLSTDQFNRWNLSAISSADIAVKAPFVPITITGGVPRGRSHAAVWHINTGEPRAALDAISA
jgi:hypothetical protein